MSDILIKGMEMPTSCWRCCLSQLYEKPREMLVCKITHGEVLRYKIDGNCPLVPVPKHGRLIDADALIADIKRQCREVFRVDAVSPDDFWITRNEAYNERLWETWCESFFGYLRTRPTIIEADGQDTNVPTREEGE